MDQYTNTVYSGINCADYEMNVDHKETLVDHFTYLKRNILLSGSTLLDNLLETGVLDDQEVDEIRSKQTNYEGINHLLHFIMRTSSEQYQMFLESLNRADHQHVYKQLTGSMFDFTNLRNNNENKNLSYF